MRNRFLWLLLFFPFCIYAIKIPIRHVAPEEEEVHAPWFTGPLLAPSSLTVPPGHYNIEPYIYCIANTARYNNHWKPIKQQTLVSTFSQPSLTFGLTNWLDFQFNPTLFYNHTHGAGKWEVGDMPILFDFQLYKFGGPHVGDWVMGLKLFLKETLPLGKYQKLNPKKLSTDIGGEGSWQTALGLVWGNLFYLGRGHFLTWRTSLQYTIPAPAHVKNLNLYGGGPGTHGTVYPPQNFSIDTAIELTLTQNWVFAMDLVGVWGAKTRFKGTTLFPMTNPPIAQFSLAPAIEYNWNGNIGLILGPWFTVAGRNILAFSGGVIALNYYQ